MYLNTAQLRLYVTLFSCRCENDLDAMIYLNNDIPPYISAGVAARCKCWLVPGAPLVRLPLLPRDKRADTPRSDQRQSAVLFSW